MMKVTKDGVEINLAGWFDKKETVNEQKEPDSKPVKSKLTKNMKDSVPESRMSKDTDKPKLSADEKLKNFKKASK